MDCSPLGSSVHGILQARILEWVVISFSRGSSRCRDQTRVSCIAGRWFTNWAMREALICHYILLKPKQRWPKEWALTLTTDLGDSIVSVVACPLWQVCHPGQDAGGGAVCMYIGPGGTWDLSVLFPQFCCEPQITPKLINIKLTIIKKRKLYLPSHSLLNIWLRD